MSLPVDAPSGESSPAVDLTVPPSAIRWLRVTWDQLTGLHIVEPHPDDHDTAYAKHTEYAADSDLSYRARGVLATLLVMQPGAPASAEELAMYGKEGREAVKAALRELAAGGYLRREIRMPLSGGTGNGMTVCPLALPGWQSTYPNATATYAQPDGSWSATKPAAAVTP